jgi:hypothetical protein
MILLLASGLRLRIIARSSGTVAAPVLYEHWIEWHSVSETSTNPHTPCSPHLSQWTRPSPLRILLRAAGSRDMDCVLLNYLF